MYGLYRDPKGEKIFSPTDGQNQSSAVQKTSDFMEDNKIVIAALKKRIRELEAKYCDGETKEDVSVCACVSLTCSNVLSRSLFYS